MSFEWIAILIFASMMITLMSGQRVFAAIGIVAVVAPLLQWGAGGEDIPFAASMMPMKWYPLLTLPLFIYMGFVLSESGIADDLYRMFHVWMGGINGGLAIGATIALPELLKRDYDKRMISGVIQAGSSLGILVPPSVVLVLYAMIARAPVGQLWLAGVFPGLMMAAMFVIYIWIRCKINPALGPALSREELDKVALSEKLTLLRAGLLPVFIFASMMVPFVNGWTSLVESSAVGAIVASLAAILKGRYTKVVFENSVRQTLSISAMFMWIILAALAFGAVFDGVGAVKAIEAFFLDDLGLGPWEILLLMQLSFLLMGTFLDDTAMLVIVAPLYVPLVGSWDPCHFNTKEPIRSLDDFKGKRIFTFPTAGRFVEQFDTIPVSLPWEDIEVAVQTGELDGIGWSGITEDYTVGWSKVTDYFLTNNISGAWAGSFFANQERSNEARGVFSNSPLTRNTI